jgi:reverse gyrase
MKDLTITELKTSNVFKLRDRWVAPAYYMSNGELGGYLFITKEEAEKELSLIITRLENKIKWQKEEEEKARALSEAENILIASYKGFLDKSPLKSGKQRATLEKTVWFPVVNRMVSKKEFVEILIEQGYKPDTRAKMVRDVNDRGYLIKDGDKRELILTKNSLTYVLNKTEWEYAEFLINNV